jgi:mono/diheme cytochrome c family protein
MWQAESEQKKSPHDFWDWKIAGLLGALPLCVLGVLIVLFVLGWNYARMKNDEAVNVYQMSMPRMDPGAFPVAGGLARVRESLPRELQNPLSFTRENFNRGKEGYDYYCIHCHGPGGKGYATVGQSFAPLPTDLSGKYVQNQMDGEIFLKTMFGYKRHPPLADTVSEQDLWAVVLYLRSLE